jgi:hypothetical protein
LHDFQVDTHILSMLTSLQARCRGPADPHEAARRLDELIVGTFTNVEQIAAAHDCTTRQVNMTISLAYLAPTLVAVVAAPDFLHLPGRPSTFSNNRIAARNRIIAPGDGTPFWANWPL